VTSEPNFERIRTECSGMLKPDVYRELYRRALAAGSGDMIEIGTALGAATVSLALAAREKGAGAVVHTFDRMEGGSRAQYGDRATNEEIARNNFRSFGVEDQVRLHVGDVEQKLPELDRDIRFSLVFIDADGKLDRDLGLLFERIEPGAPIIIDDCDDVTKLGMVGWPRLRVGLKHRLTFHLVQAFLEHRYLEEGFLMGNTYFSRKGAARMSQEHFGVRPVDQSPRNRRHLRYSPRGDSRTESRALHRLLRGAAIAGCP